jgi:hypothetical protein
VYAIYQGNKKKRKTEFEEFCPPPPGPGSVESTPSNLHHLLVFRHDDFGFGFQGTQKGSACDFSF